MTRPPRKHTMTSPPKADRSTVLFIVSALAVIALALGARAIWPARDAPAANVVGAGITGELDTDETDGTISMGPPSPPATQAPQARPVIAPPGVITRELAASTVTGFVASVAAIDPVSADVSAQLSTVATGTILAEIENQGQELEANGWSLSGTPVVTSVTIISTNRTGNPSTALVQACVDSSKVVTLDANGTPIGGPDSPPPALNLFSMQQDAGVWRVISRTFPNDPAC